MDWIALKSESQLKDIQKESEERPVVIFKHSTACAISATALNRLERSWKPGELTQVKAYYLDLLSYRDISRQTAHFFGVVHESPQLLLIDKGKCVYNASHLGITFNDLKEHALKAQD